MTENQRLVKISVVGAFLFGLLAYLVFRFVSGYVDGETTLYIIVFVVVFVIVEYLGQNPATLAGLALTFFRVAWDLRDGKIDDQDALTRLQLLLKDVVGYWNELWKSMTDKQKKAAATPAPASTDTKPA
jgi:hypothetical protein